MPTIYTADELVKEFSSYGQTQPAAIELLKKTLINFKSPNIKRFEGMWLPGGNFSPKHIQYLYTEGILKSDYRDLERTVNYLKTTLYERMVNAIRGQKYQISVMERIKGTKDVSGRDRLLLLNEMLSEIPHIIQIITTAIPATKMPYVKNSGEDGATILGIRDATEKKPMDPVYVDLAGTDLDNYAQAYTKAYVATREKVGAKRRMTKRHTKKTQRRSRK